MFERFITPKPMKIMNQRLSGYCPDASIWNEVSLYLVKGKRPKNNAAQKAIRAYLDLREGLGGLAAFRAGGKLCYSDLEQPCRDHFKSCGLESPGGPGSLRAWARFLLAADYLLARTYEEMLSNSSANSASDTEWEKVRQEYLAPMLASGGKASVTPISEHDAGSTLNHATEARAA